MSRSSSRTGSSMTVAGRSIAKGLSGTLTTGAVVASFEDEEEEGAEADGVANDEKVAGKTAVTGSDHGIGTEETENDAIEGMIHGIEGMIHGIEGMIDETIVDVNGAGTETVTETVTEKVTERQTEKTIPRAAAAGQTTLGKGEREIKEKMARFYNSCLF